MSRDDGLPFGRPFKYTDAHDLKTRLDRKPWYKRLWKQKKPVVAWLVSEDLEPVAVIPIYDQDAVEELLITRGRVAESNDS